MRPVNRSLLLQLHDAKGRGPGARHCEARGCTQATREGKPFCSDHVDQHPYVRDLLADLAAQEEDEERIRRKRSRGVDVNGPTATRILHYLEQNGARTVERLTRDTQLEETIVEAVTNALKKQGLVTFGQTRRGSRIVKLKPKPSLNGEHPD